MNVVSVALDSAWLLMAGYGLHVQWLALKFSRRNWSVAKFMPLSGVLVMAHARLRSNVARMSVIVTNALIGIVAMALAIVGHSSATSGPLWVAIVNFAIGIGFIANELVMILIARLEVAAHRKLVKHGLNAPA